MKNILIFFTILCVVSAQNLMHLVPAHSICPNVIGDQDILLPSPIDCSVYYRCENGMAIPQFCPKGLQWCQVLTKCTLPILANCTLNYTLVTYSPGQLATYTPYPSTTQSVTSSLSENTTIPTERICPIDGATIPNPFDCNSYYICDNGEAVSRNCPVGEQYSSWDEICYPSMLANCIYFDSSNKTGDLCLNDITIPNTVNCSTYYKCINGVVVLKVCDAGLTYSPWNRDCRNNSDCTKYLEESATSSSTIDITTTTLNLNLPNFNSIICPFDGAKLPDPFDCNSYFICQNAEPSRLQCPSGSQYSCWDQICESNVTVDCINFNSGNQSDRTCSCADLTMPNIQNCTTYYKCVKGRVKLEICSTGATYNPWLGSCSHDGVCKSYLGYNTTSTGTSSSTIETITNFSSTLPTTNIISTVNPSITPPIESTTNPINTINATNPISTTNAAIVSTTNPISTTNAAIVTTTNTVSTNYNTIETIISTAPTTITIPISTINTSTITTASPENSNKTSIVTATSPDSTNISTIATATSPESLENTTILTTVSTVSSISITTGSTISPIITTSPANTTIGSTSENSTETDIVTTTNTANTNSTTVETSISTIPTTLASTTSSENINNTTIVTAASPDSTNITTTVTVTGPESTNSTTLSSIGTISTTIVNTTNSSTTPSTPSTAIYSYSDTSTNIDVASTTNTVSTNSTISSIPTTIVTPTSSENTNNTTIVTTTSSENTNNTTIVTATSPESTNITTTVTVTGPESTNSTTVVTSINTISTTIVNPTTNPIITTTPTIASTTNLSITGSTTINAESSTNTDIVSTTNTASTNSTTIKTTISTIPTALATNTNTENTNNTTIVTAASSDSTDITTTVTVTGPESTNSTTVVTSINTIPTTIANLSTNSIIATSPTIRSTTNPSSTINSETSTNTAIATTANTESINSTTIETTVSTIPTTIIVSATPQNTNNTTIVTATSTDSAKITTSATTITISTIPTITASTIIPITSNSSTIINTNLSTVGSTTIPSENNTNPFTTSFTTSQITTNPTTAINLPSIPCPTDYILYPSSRGDCHAYMKCVAGQLLEVLCNPPTYNYNCATEQCENITECCASNNTTTPVNNLSTTNESITNPSGDLSSPGSTSTTIETTINPYSTSRKPPSILCPRDGILYPSYIGDCQGYMICINGQLIQKKCEPPTYKYNCVTEQCENITHCCASGGPISPTTKEISTLTTPTTIPVPLPSLDSDICPINGAKLPNPIDCTSYYVCQNNIPISQKCSEGEKYSCWDQLCKSSENVICIKEGYQQGQTCTNEGEQNANLDDCSSYYKCTKGKIEIAKCASGTFYNSWFKNCFNFSLAWCQTYPIIPPTSTIEPPPSTKGPSDTNNTCPMEGAKLPNVLDCSTYYVCINGEPILQNCPSYQIYSCWDQKCLFISEGQCITFDDTTNGNCSIDGLQMPNINDCSSYYECSNNSITAIKCPDGMMYNSWFKKCTEEKFAYCQTISTPTGPFTTSAISSSTVSPAPNICPIEGALLPNPTNCAAYYVCQNGLPVSQICPDGDQYSCWDQNCVTSSSNSVCITNGNQEGLKCSIEGEMLPNIADCSSFYICVNGKVELHICASGSIYSEWFKICLNASIFGEVALQFCKTFPTLPPITLPPLQITTISPSVDRDLCPVNHALLPNPIDCSTYYECINYTPVLLNCAIGMSYSCWDQKCMNASDATCITSIQIGGNCSSENLKLADIQNCRKYYQCVAGRIVMKQCLIGLQFNNRYQKCMLPEFAHCQTYTRSTVQPATKVSNSPPVTLSPTDDVCPNEGALLPNPLSCSTYYKCVNGTPILQICAAGLEYSCWDMTCLTPVNAKCMATGIHVGQYCTINGEMLQNPNDCQSYYQCTNYSVVLKKCLFNGYYNKWFHMCVPFAILAHCQQTPIITTSVAPSVRPPIQPQILNVCPINGSILPNPTDCNSYYKCINNKPVVQRCPDDEEYNCWDQTCQLADVAQCISTGSQVGEICSREGVRLPNPENCNSFYECRNGKVELNFCFLGLEYNKWFERCTIILYSHCRTYTTMPVPEPIIGPSTEIATTIEYSNSVCPQDGLKIPNPNDCHTYFVCENLIPVLHSCPDNSNYDCWSQKCDLVILARCVNTPQGYVGELCFKEGETVPKISDCNRYYICQNGIIVEKSCPLFQQYSVWRQKCMLIGLAKCANSKFLGII